VIFGSGGTKSRSGCLLNAKRGSGYAVHRMPSVPGAGGNVNPSRLPAHDRFRRILVIAGRSGEGLLTEPTTAAQPWRRERLFMPQTVWKRPEIAVLSDSALGEFAL